MFDQFFYFECLCDNRYNAVICWSRIGMNEFIAINNEVELAQIQ